MKDTAKLATGVAAMCPAGIAKCLPWLLLLGALYGEQVWVYWVCEIFENSHGVWQVANVAVFIIWGIANLFGLIIGPIVVAAREFRNYSLPVGWGVIWWHGRDVRLYEPVLWITFAPTVATVTLAEALVRIGSVKIRRDRP